MAGSAEGAGGSSKAHMESPGLVSDCRLMVSFARKNGFVLPQPLVHEIGWLDSVLKALDIHPVSQLPAPLIWPIDLTLGQPTYVANTPGPDAPLRAGAASAVVPAMSPEEVILDIHSRLSLLIAPTTALSLQTSEPPAGRRHIFGGMPPLVQYVIVIAFISAICFAFSAAKIASRRTVSTAASAATDSAASAALALPRPAPPAAPTFAEPSSTPAPATAASTSAASAPAARASRRAPARSDKASEGVKS